ncbi:MAG: mechanosensitive ion channel family protein [Clostridiaceae bacterium]|nr:mechanosensitive ion channel family protein [Clostridiaceae bacterium]
MEDIKGLWEQIKYVFTYTLLEVEVWKLVTACVIILFSLFLRKFFVNLILRLLKKITQRTKTTLDDELVSAIDPPARLLIVTAGFTAAFWIIGIDINRESFAGQILRTVVAFTVFWTLYRAGDILAKLFERFAKRTRTTLDDILIPYIRKGIKAIIVIIGISVIAKEWNYDLGALLTGLGLGGLAFALAAQETVANFFGGLTIMVDKPFQIGDWIQTSDVEGTVEDIGFRSTRIRTFAQALVTVPNSGLAKSNITNWSRMGKRRITFNISLTYATSTAQIENLLARIRDMLENHPGIHPETIFVFFDSFGQNGPELFLYFFTKTIKWKEYLEVREDTNLKLMRILDELGLKVAYPSMSVYMEKQPESPERIEE